MSRTVANINFRQPKYVLPAILYPLILGTGYLFIDMFSTEVGEKEDKQLQTTEYLNSNLPSANIKGEGIGSKYESMLHSYGKIDDLSGISNIDRNEESNKEEYESRYTDADIAAMEQGSEENREAMERLKEMQSQLQQSADRGNAMVNDNNTAGNGYNNTEAERIARTEQREKEYREELERELAKARLSATGSIGSTQNTEQQKPDSNEQPANNNSTSHTVKPSKNQKAVTSIDDDEEASSVVKKIKTSSDYFNTITENEPEQKLIKAIIDENVKVSDGTRVRLRLLDDIEIDEKVLKKGSYLYATMSAASGQRIKGSIKSILIHDDLIKVSLSIYDTDGMEGLYVPGNQLRDTGKDVASGAMSGNMQVSNGNTGNNLSQWGMQTVQNAYQKTTNAIGKAIKKNTVKLKYGTFVYLVNGKEKK